MVVTPEAQSRGARGLLGVVGEVGCEQGIRLQISNATNRPTRAEKSYFSCPECEMTASVVVRRLQHKYQVC